jgi:hypothetical protein
LDLMNPHLVGRIFRLDWGTGMLYGLHEVRKLLVLATLLCSVALAESAVKSSYLPGTDFSKYRTYTWVEVKGRQHPDPDKDAQIKQLIDSQLAKRGLTRTDGTADLSVDYQVAITKTEKWQVYEDWSEWTGVARIPTKKMVTITVGTLVVDMYDTALKKLVWSGSATKTVDGSGPQKQAKQAIQALLKDFPPPAQKEGN